MFARDQFKLQAAASTLREPLKVDVEGDHPKHAEGSNARQKAPAQPGLPRQLLSGAPVKLEAPLELYWICRGIPIPSPGCGKKGD